MKIYRFNVEGLEKEIKHRICKHISINLQNTKDKGEYSKSLEIDCKPCSNIYKIRIQI